MHCLKSENRIIFNSIRAFNNRISRGTILFSIRSICMDAVIEFPVKNVIKNWIFTENKSDRGVFFFYRVKWKTMLSKCETTKSRRASKQKKKYRNRLVRTAVRGGTGARRARDRERVVGCRLVFFPNRLNTAVAVVCVKRRHRHNRGGGIDIRCTNWCPTRPDPAALLSDGSAAAAASFGSTSAASAPRSDATVAVTACLTAPDGGRPAPAARDYVLNGSFAAAASNRDPISDCEALSQLAKNKILLRSPCKSNCCSQVSNLKSEI